MQFLVETFKSDIQFMLRIFFNIIFMVKNSRTLHTKQITNITKQYRVKSIITNENKLKEVLMIDQIRVLMLHVMFDRLCSKKKETIEVVNSHFFFCFLKFFL